jgi:dTDP-4-amino-4,6-dideoxygalactose transaminase
MFGHPARLDLLVEICKNHGLYLVEDAAQAHAARFLDIPIGSWGDLAAFSFYPTKNMTTGEGGIVTTKNSEFADKIRLLRNQGMKERYVHEVVGLNNRMTEFSAAIGIGQLKKLHRSSARRKKNAEYLTERIMEVDTPKIDSQASHVFHQYTVRVRGGKRDRFVEELRSRGIGAQVYYPTPVHEQPAYKVPITLPETSLACSEVVSIPVHPKLSKRDLKQIVAAVNSVAKLVLN